MHELTQLVLAVPLTLQEKDLSLGTRVDLDPNQDLQYFNNPGFTNNDARSALCEQLRAISHERLRDPVIYGQWTERGRMKVERVLQFVLHLPKLV